MSRVAMWFGRASTLGVGALLLAMAGASFAQAAAPINGIYTCTDANGRKLRSDRPIPACSDREQIVLNPSGTVRARVGPSLSAQQRAELEERKREVAAERTRLQEERRRDRAMLARYPSRESHDKERADAVARVNMIVQEAEKSIVILQEERGKIDRELEFYQGDATKAPPALQGQITHVTQGLQAQRRFIHAQESERQRLNAHFDEELVRLTPLWQENARAAATEPRAGGKP